MIEEGVLATLDGRLAEAAVLYERMLAQSEEHGLPFARVAAGLAGKRALLHLGRVEEALGSPVTRAGMALCLAYAGHAAEATALLDELVVARPSIGAPPDETPIWWGVALLEAGVLVEHREAVALLLAGLADSPFATSGMSNPTCIARHLGAAAALLGRADEARGYADQALKVAELLRFRPEIALTHLQLAELLLDGADPAEHADAVAHLDVAIEEFRAMQMRPSLERALRHKELLQA